MHLNKILEQIKRHQSPTEAIDKLATALEKHEGSLLEKGFTILKSELAANMYEAINGPHFDEEHAHYAVEGMENEDGTKGPHWTVEETTSVANQMGINLKSEKHNKWDWFVAMNMIYSDFYKAVVAMTGSANTKYFAELAKAWLCDKDISEGKMWHYYVYIMCDDEENDYKAYERMHRDREEEYGRYARRSGRMEYANKESDYRYPYSKYYDEYERPGRNRYYELEYEYDAQTQIINDKFCQLEMREMQNKIDTLRDEKNALQSSALLQQQTSNIVSQIRPCPVPAYLTCNPYGCNGGLNGYGYGYPYGYGDSCCA